MPTIFRHGPTFVPALTYTDKATALKWLAEAFGFEPSSEMTNAEGKIIHAEMTFGDSVIAIASEYEDWARTPASVGGKNTQRIHVRIPRGIDEHCARARRAGARIAVELFDASWGERVYAAVDLDGHYWCFTQPPAHRPRVIDPSVEYLKAVKAGGAKRQP